MADIKSIIIDEIIKASNEGKMSIEQAAKALAMQSKPCEGLAIDGKTLEKKELDEIKNQTCLPYFSKAYSRMAKQVADRKQYEALKESVSKSLDKFIKDLQAEYPKETQSTLYKLLSACIMDVVEPKDEVR